MLVFVLGMLFPEGNVHGQTPTNTLKIKGNYKDKPLDLVILDLNINYRLQFEYQVDLKEIIINKSFGKLPLSDGLKLLLQGTGLSFEIVEERLIRLFEGELPQQNDQIPSNDQPTKANFIINGSIKDANSGESLPFASVVIKNTIIGASTNVDGHFTLFDVPSDTSLLVIQYLGYRTKYFRLTPGMDFENLVLELEDFSQQLAEVIVIAQEERAIIESIKRNQ